MKKEKRAAKSVAESSLRSLTRLSCVKVEELERGEKLKWIETTEQVLWMGYASRIDFIRHPKIGATKMLSETEAIQFVVKQRALFDTDPDFVKSAFAKIAAKVEAMIADAKESL